MLDSIKREVRLFKSFSKLKRNEMVEVGTYCGATAALAKFAPEPNTLIGTGTKCFTSSAKLLNDYLEFREDPCSFVNTDKKQELKYFKRLEDDPLLRGCWEVSYE